MSNESILAYIKSYLENDHHVSNIHFNLWMKRYFSTVYQVSGTVDNSVVEYVLKISTTSRSCRHEYEQYVYLNKASIRTLNAIHFSEKHNCLLTVKEELTPFDEHLKSLNNHSSQVREFQKLGSFFKDLDKKTAETVRFSKSDFLNYYSPRLKKLDHLPKILFERINSTLSEATDLVDGTERSACFVSDYSLGNIHIDKDGYFVLLDLGDSYIGDTYINISALQLACYYGPLSHYFSLPHQDKKHFKAFIHAYLDEEPNKFFINLYEVGHLITMILFVHNLNPSSNNFFRNFASIASNQYLERRYVARLKKAVDQLDLAVQKNRL